MSHDDLSKDAVPSKDGRSRQKQQQSSFFQIPSPLKRVFDKFPLVTYAENELPLGAPAKKKRSEHALYVFVNEDEAQQGRPSFNPACLRWQTYLKVSGMPHRLVASNNHASPSGSLPFLLPTGNEDGAGSPVPGNRLKKWVTAQQKAQKTLATSETEDARYDAYHSLLETPIRVAWLYQLYLNPANSPLLRRRYIAPCSSNPSVQMTIAYQLRQAAETEMVKATGSSTVVEEDVLRAAEDAMAALSTLLGNEQWFFGQSQPGLFDASVFAYTHLLLDEETMAWEENHLGKTLRGFENLISHRDRIIGMYYQ